MSEKEGGQKEEGEERNRKKKEEREKMLRQEIQTEIDSEHFCVQLLGSGEKDEVYLNLCSNKQGHNRISSSLYPEQMSQSGSLG